MSIFKTVMVAAVLSILPFRGTASAQPAGTIDAGTSIDVRTNEEINTNSSDGRVYSGTSQALIVPTAAADSETPDRCTIGGLDIIRRVTDHNGLVRTGVCLLQGRMKNIRIRFGVVGIVGGRCIIDKVLDSRTFEKAGGIRLSG